MTSRSASHTEGGFTLVELLVVVAALALLLFAAVPVSGSGDAFPLDMSEVRVRDACDWARRLASSQRRAHGVVFDPSTDRLAVVQEDGVEAAEPLSHQPYVVSLRQDHGVDVLAADFGSTGTVLVFDATGLPVRSGTVRLSRGSAQLQLDVDAATGQLRRQP